MFNREGDPTNNIWPTRNSLRDRIFAAGGHNPSSDSVIQQLRDDLDKQRQMFFDRLAQPQWETASRQGFPFPDAPRRFGVERTSFPHFDDADVWVEDERQEPRQRWPSSGSGRSSCSSASGDNSSHGSGVEAKSAARSDSPHTNRPLDSPRMRKPAARSATGDFPTLSSGDDGVTRGFRASSAPPMNCGSPKRFTTSVHMPCNGVDHQKQQQQQQAAHQAGGPAKCSESEPKASNVRHIPIFVEGRDEPVLPRVVEEENDSRKDSENRKQQPSAAASSPVPGAKLAGKHMDDRSTSNKKPIPMPFYSLTPTKTDAAPQSPTVRDSSIAIPLPFVDDGAPPVVDQPPQEAAIPMPYTAPPTSNQDAGCGSQDRVDGLSKRVELERIDNIQREAEALFPRIESFRGYRDDREFLYLDEMLTRLLLKLDDVVVEGREDVRHARKQAIASIQRCISLLESKNGNNAQPDGEAAPTENGDANDVQESPRVISSVVIPMNTPLTQPTNCESGAIDA